MGSRVEVMLDGGFWRGTDIAKALALGARAVALGRAPLYGLAAGGEPGALRSLEILKTELDRTLALLGCPSVAELDPSFLFMKPPVEGEPPIRHRTTRRTSSH